MIELQGVGFRTGGRRVLSEVSLGLGPGAFRVVAGPPGAGKTTLLRICAGELAPTEGRATLRRARGHLGVMRQDGRFLDHLSVAENVLLPLVVAGRAAEGRAHLADLLAWVGLGGKAGLGPAELSGAERQRALLARAVVAAPDAILADEPTGGLDGDARDHVLSLLLELNRLGKAVLVATGDPRLAAVAAAEGDAPVLRLDGGRLAVAEAPA